MVQASIGSYECRRERGAVDKNVVQGPGAHSSGDFSDWAWLATGRTLTRRWQWQRGACTRTSNTNPWRKEELCNMWRWDFDRRPDERGKAREVTSVLARFRGCRCRAIGEIEDGDAGGEENSMFWRERTLATRASLDDQRQQAQQMRPKESHTKGRGQEGKVETLPSLPSKRRQEGAQPGQALRTHSRSSLPGESPTV